MLPALAHLMDPTSSSFKLHEPRPSTVLVVDDDSSSRESLGELLQNLGHRVLYAENGKRALDLLRRESAPPTVILLDLMMPVMNGWQFLEARHQDAELSRVPVLVISAALDASAALPGVTGYLRKPVASEQVISQLERIRAGAPVAATPEAPTCARAHPERPRVLLVQESDTDAAATTAHLTTGAEVEFEVQRAKTLDELATRDAFASVDVVLLDATATGEAPLTILQKTARRAPGLPIVALLPAAELRTEALRRGAEEALIKTAQTPELLGRALHHAMERHHLRAELEQARELAAHERERRSLERLSRSRSTVAAELLGQVALRQAAPAAFERFVKEFVVICERSIAEREHELEATDQRRELHRFSEALATLRVGPGDIVDVYQEALQSGWSTEGSELGAAKREEARLMLIGILGYVLASYRLYVNPQPPPDSVA